MIKSYAFIHIIFLVVELMSVNSNTLEVKNFDEQLFLSSVSLAEEYEIDQVKSMVVPHHLLAADLIANAYITGSSDDVKRIVLISPDHNSISSRKIITSKKDWSMVDADKEYIDKLLELSFVYEDDNEIEMEHGINVHIPYISKYFRNAKLIPLAVTKEIRRKELDELVDFISDDCMIIASVDFSHYLNLEEANKCDKVTLEIINSGDNNLFLGRSDKYYDSQGTLYTIFNHAKKYGYDPYVLDNSNSAYYIHRDIPETTSYFVIAFK